MPEGDIYVLQDGDDWTLTVEDITLPIFRYATRGDAVEAGSRVAGAAGSRLVLVGDAPGRGALPAPTTPSAAEVAVRRSMPPDDVTWPELDAEAA